MYPDSIKNLVESFKYLPGIEEKTAERLAFSILELENEQISMFSDSLKEVKVSVSTGTATFIDEMDVESQYLNANLNYLNAQKALILSYYKMVSMTGVGKLPVM